MLSNRITLENITDCDPEQAAVMLSAEELDMLGEDLKAEESRVKGYKAALDAVISAKYSDLAKAERGEEEYGTARVEDGEFVAVSNLPKKVDWNQSQLAAIVARIRASGDKPEDYVKVEYSIEEKKWNSWPDAIKRQFLEARSVKAGKEVIKLERKKS